MTFGADWGVLVGDVGGIFDKIEVTTHLHSPAIVIPDLIGDPWGHHENIERWIPAYPGMTGERE